MPQIQIYPLISDANHGIDVGDIDNDGDIDFIAIQQPRQDASTEENKSEIFINDGSGHFTYEKNRLPSSNQLSAGNCAGFLDVDRDGITGSFFRCSIFREQ